MFAEPFRFHGVDFQPVAGTWHQHTQRVAKEWQRRQPALFFNRKRRHRHIQLAVRYGLLHGQAAKFRNLQLHAGVALAKQANRPGHHHPHHRRNAQAQQPFREVVNITKLSLKLAKLCQDRQPALEYDASGVGQQQLAPVADK